MAEEHIPRKPRISLQERQAMAVKALQEGVLPAVHVSRFDGGFGCMRECPLCRHPVRREHLCASVKLSDRLLEFHVECFHAWQMVVPPDAPRAEGPDLSSL